jgi:ferrous iron transport protein A
VENFVASKINQIPLAELVTGENATVISFTAGRAVINRMASLGITPGAKIDMTQNYGHGPLIVIVRGTRVALGRGEAAKVLVERGTE